jgi:sugar lactone lactonase YvrE
MRRAVLPLVEGIYFGEGPRWRQDETGGRLWFSDFHAHAVKSVSLAGDLRTELELDDQPSGLGWMPDGSLLVVSMKKRQLWRRWPDGRFAMHADLADYSTHLCNDMVVDEHGRAYVGNFGFDLDAAMAERGPEGVIANHATTPVALVQPDGKVSSAAGDERFSFPNGSVITADGQTLVVAETFAGRLSAFDIASDGHLVNRREWASTWPRIPDGICLDAAGAIWIANPAAPECVRIAQGGEVLEVIDGLGQNCYACMLGGPDGKHLFMLTAPANPAAAALGKVLVAELDVGRAGWP